MKASTLFGMTIALLLGLGTVVGAKYLGYFDAAPPAPAKKAGPEPQILVANKNLFKGTMATAADVKVRAVTEAELDYYERNRDKLLAAVASAAEMRVLAKNVTAGQPLFEDHFERQAVPEAISERLEPGMRSVNLLLPRERAAGGIIRVGERVDVLWTSTIAPEGRGGAFTATATIARNLKVVVKRDNLWTVMAPVPEDKPASFTLQANPYRAALIEFAKLKGVLTLAPAAAPLMMGRSDREGPMSDPDSREYRDEDKRVGEFVNNEHIISDADLERIFNLRLMPVPQPPQVAKVELLVGTRVEATALIGNGEVLGRLPRTAATTQKAVDAATDCPTCGTESAVSAYRFSHPEAGPAANGKAADCPSCKAGKKG